MVELEVFDLLKKHKWTVSFAESCTGGLLSSHFVAIPGVSAVFKGAIVSYCNEVKIKHLGVSSDLLSVQGPVNEQTALEMARGVRQRLQTDWAVSTTGIAGPAISKTADVGKVCFAVIGPQFEESLCKVLSGLKEAGSSKVSLRDLLRKQAVDKAFCLLKKGVLASCYSPTVRSL